MSKTVIAIAKADQKPSLETNLSMFPSPLPNYYKIKYL
jgi:hypothetical protein